MTSNEMVLMRFHSTFMEDINLATYYIQVTVKEKKNSMNILLNICKP